MLTKLIHRLPMRVRMTAWIVAVAAVIQLAVGVVFYLYQRQAVHAFFDEHLRLRSDGMIADLSQRVPWLSKDELNDIAERHARYSAFTGFALAIFDENGRVVLSTFEIMDVSVHGPEVAEVIRTGRPRFIIAPAIEVKRFDPDAKAGRGIERGFMGRDGKRYGLLARTSDSNAQRMLGLVSNALFIAFPTGVVVAGLSGWFIGGIAARPLELVRASAERLTPERIGERIRLRDAVGTASPEQSRLEDALEQARQRLSAAFASQERFMTNVSHELKTPIAVLLTEAQTLDLRSAPKEVSNYVRSVMDEMRRLGAMVDSFLLLTRVREGRSLTQDRVYPLNEVVMESVERCEAMARQYQVRLAPQLSEADPAPLVRGDPALLRTMIDNLIRNAIRFSPQNEVIDVEAGAEGNLATIRVRDRGTGIPDAIIDRIFDRFVQAADEHRRGRGHGLGLEIAQGIAELHGGRIEARNCLENSPCDPADPTVQMIIRGCEFLVRLPRVRTETPSLPETGVE